MVTEEEVVHLQGVEERITYITLNVRMSLNITLILKRSLKDIYTFHNRTN